MKCPTLCHWPSVPDDLPTVWPATPHTLAKHAILRGYLEAWMPILTRHASERSQSRRQVSYVDGFAGPGEYVQGESGSPLVAVDVALGHSQHFPIPVKMLFVEERRDRFDHLCGLLAGRKDEISSSDQLDLAEPRCGDCEATLDEILDRCRQKSIPFGPALVFLDQFGYSAVSIDLVRRVLGHPSAEIFTFLNWRDLNHYVSDSTKWPGITRAFGGEEWMEILDLPKARRASGLLDHYRSALRDRAASRYHCFFAMHDLDGGLLYWLFFCTGNLRGLEEMKRAMWKVDTTGSFRFFDRHGDQMILLPGFDQDWLAEKLMAELQGRKLTTAEIKEYVLVETPCYLFSGALKKLERENRVRILGAPRGRRQGSFAKYLGNSTLRICFE